MGPARGVPEESKKWKSTRENNQTSYQFKKGGASNSSSKLFSMKESIAKKASNNLAQPNN